MSELSVNLKKAIEQTIPDLLMQALNDGLQIIENQAKINCPVDDGTLRASITHNSEKEGDLYNGVIGSNVEYAAFKHEGTGLYAREGKGRKDVPWVYRTAEGDYYTTEGQKPNPFLQEAIDSKKEEFLKRFEGIL